VTFGLQGGVIVYQSIYQQRWDIFFIIHVVEGDIQWKWLWKKFASTYYDK